MIDLVIVGVISSAVGAAIGAVGKSIVDYFKNRNETTLTNTDKAFRIFQTITDELQSDINILKQEQKISNEQHLKCREENAELRVKILYIQKEVDFLRSKVPQEDK